MLEAHAFQAIADPLHRALNRPLNRPLRGCWRLALLATLVGLPLAGGCGGESSGRVPVGGTVTMAGTPLAKGTVEFHPVSSGTMTGGTIRDGRFAIPASQGAMPGEYQVRIFATDDAGEPVEDPNLPPGMSDRPLQPELIPPRYNTETELTATIEAAGSTDLIFALD